MPYETSATTTPTLSTGQVGSLLHRLKYNIDIPDNYEVTGFNFSYIIIFISTVRKKSNVCKTYNL